MPRFSAGSASVSIVPDLRGFQTAMARELGRLGNDVKINVRPELDRSAIGNIDRQVSRLRPSMKVDLDTRHATAALAGLAKLSGAAFSALGSQAAVGGLVAVAGAAAQAGGALALLPALGAAAAAPLAALVVGAQGIGDAFKAAGAATAASGVAAQSSAATQAAAAKQVESAQRGVEQAHRRVEDAQRGVQSAVRQVADAERDFARAQASSLRAQEDLNAARQQAVRDLQDLSEQLSDAALDEEGAVLAVERAQERLIEATKEGSTASALDRKEADLGYRRSLASLEDVRQRNVELAATVADANAKGVEGSDLVVAARERVADAQQREIDAQEGIADAQRGVADAQRDLLDAQRGVLDAQREVAEAMAAGAASTGAQATAAAGLAAAMANLSPHARDFVQSIQDLKPAFDDMRLDVQERLFAGLGDRMRDLGNNYLPLFKSQLSEVAGLLNGGFASSLDVLNKAGSLSDVSTVFDNIRAALAPLTAAMAPLVQALLDITTVGSTFLPELGAQLGGALQGFADFIAEARASGALAEFIQTGIDTLKQLGSILLNVGKIFGAVFSAGSETGGGFLATIEKITGEIAKFLSSVEGQTALTTFFDAVGAAVTALAPLITTVASIFLTTLAPALANLATQLAPIAQVLLVALGDGLKQIAPLMPLVGGAIGALVSAFVPLIPIFVQLITALLPPVLDLITALAPIVGVLAEAVGQALVQAVVGLVPLLIEVGRQLMPALLEIVQQIIPVLPSLVALFLQIVTALMPFIPPLIRVALDLLPIFVRVLEAVIPVLGFVIQALAPLLKLMAEVGVPTFGAIGAAFRVMSDVISFIWNSVIKPVFDVFGGAIEWLGDQFKIFGDVAAEVWDGVLDTIINVINSVIDVINGFLDGLNFVAGLVGIDLNLHVDHVERKKEPPKPTGAGTGGSGGTNKRLAEGGLAGDGGRVSGVGRGDHVRALLEPDEIVIRKRVAVPYKNFLLALNAGQPEALQAAGGRNAQGPMRFAKGGSVADALAFAKRQEGKPYIWGGVGPRGYDCSGYMSDIANTIAGTALHQRRFTTSSMVGGRDAGGFVRGADGAFTIGVDPGSHTAGTLAGINVESGSGHGPMVGKRALGTDSSFQYKYTFPGAGGLKASLAEIAQAIADPIKGTVRSLSGGNVFGDLVSEMASRIIDGLVGGVGDLEEGSSVTGGDPGRPEPASVTAARSALEFDRGGFLPPGYSTVYNGTGGPEALMRIEQPEQLGVSGGSAGATGIDNRGGTIIVRDYDELQRKQDRAARRAQAAAGVR